MIDHVKIIIIAVILSTVFGSGWWLGNSRYVEYKKSVEAVAKAQEEKVKSIRSQQELVTKGIKDEYDAKLSLLRQYYANGVRKSSSGSVPTNPLSTIPTDAVSSYNVLAGQCAETTLQLVELQKWLNEQIGIK
jgi:hypothetical protein